MEILDGKTFKDETILKMKKEIDGLNLSLAVIQIGNDEASSVYINQKRIMCESLNIKFKQFKLKDDVSESDVIELIEKLNNDNEITGILLQLPIPKHLNKQRIIDSINYKKDVDGLTTKNAGNLLLGIDSIVPCTPIGIINLLKHYNIELSGKRVTIIGRSNLVGKPLAILMLRENATVTICHSNTKNIKEITFNSDIVISATGKSGLITEDMIRDNSVVIDVGISRVGGRLLGDVDYNNVSKKCSYITPVPGGVGPMTILSLAQNIHKAYLLQNH